jgi:hypothetical protein
LHALAGIALLLAPTSSLALAGRPASDNAVRAALSAAASAPRSARGARFLAADHLGVATTHEDAATTDAVDTVVLRVRGLDPAVLRAALIRRRPDLAVRDDAPADAVRSAFVEVVATPPDVTLDVVLADGRAYRRALRPGNAPGERAAARLLVQLLAAIAERRAEPERRDVPIPAWTRDTPEQPRSPEPGADPSPAHVPDPPPPAAPSPAHMTDPPPVATDAPAITEPDPPPAPPAKPPRTPAEPPATKPASSRPSAASRRGPLELGLAADFSAVLGLTPPRDVSALRGLGGALHLDLRLPRGLVIGLAARGLARGADGFHLARLRGAASLGHLYRRDRFELLTSAGLSFETWRVRQAGDGVYYAEPGADTRPLLIGGLVRVAPGARLTPGRRVALRLGAWLELAGSVLPTGAAARLSATRHDGAAPLPLFALGGLELAMGVELAAWFTLRRPAKRP